MLIEKTKLFHKLNFATRYNLRDTFRHKARTFMSIFGVLGCTLLLFATFGMKSTMDDYIDANYNIAMNYETSITLSDNVVNNRALEIANQYNGDYSSSIATKVDGATYVLTLLNNNNDRVRLLKDNKAVGKLNNNGVYICKRMAEALNKNVGDKFSFSLYGKAAKYEVEIADIISSSTNGFTMTYDLANSLNLDYKINNIYVDNKKDSLSTNDEIVSLSSREELIKTFDSFMEIMNLMIYFLVAFSLLLAFVVLYNLGTMSYIERYRELATLKVLGFKNKKIGSILISQNTFTTIIGIILGCPLGYASLILLFKLLAAEYELTITCSYYVYIVSIVLTFLVSLVVSYFTSLKVKKINMVEALKAE